ncbi:MAG: hypothetical protein JSV33_03255, partial [bacterium]
MKTRALYILFCLHFLIVTSIPTGGPAQADDRSKKLDTKLERIGMALAAKGEFVHNVGQLQMNITNWGFMGSLPK